MKNMKIYAFFMLILMGWICAAAVPNMPTTSLPKGIKGTATITNLTNCTGAFTPFTLHFNTGWNLISIPGYVMGGSAVSSILPPGTIGAWGYNSFTHSYYTATNFDPCVGYWVYSTHDQDVDLCVEANYRCCYNLTEGWNLVGAPYYSSPVPVGIMSAYEYTSSGYSLASTLNPGKGYWFLTTSPVYTCTNYTETGTCDVLDESVTIRFSIGNSTTTWTAREGDGTVVSGVTIFVSSIDETLGAAEPCAECPVLDERVTLRFTAYPNVTTTWTAGEGDATVVGGVTAFVSSIDETLSVAQPCEECHDTTTIMSVVNGSTLSLGYGYTLHLTDIGVAEPCTIGGVEYDNCHAALFDVIDTTTGTVVPAPGINHLFPGECGTWNYPGTSEYVTVCINRTAYGYELMERWALVSVICGGNETETECDGTIYGLGETVYSYDSYRVILNDIGVAEGTDHHHNALLGVYINSSYEIDHASIAPGEEQTIYLEGEPFCFRVCGTTYGYELFNRWAEIQVTPGVCERDTVCNGTIYELRDFLFGGSPVSSYSAQLVDIGVAEGTDNHHNALIEVHDSTGDRGVSIAPGEERTISINNGTVNYCVYVCKTVYGLELMEKWAQLGIRSGVCEHDTYHCNGATYQLGDTVVAYGGEVLRFTDIGMTEGLDNHHNALLSSEYHSYSITPGTQQTVSVGSHDYCLKVCDTAYGYELFARWANIEVTDGPCGSRLLRPVTPITKPTKLPITSTSTNSKITNIPMYEKNKKSDLIWNK